MGYAAPSPTVELAANPRFNYCYNAVAEWESAAEASTTDTSYDTLKTTSSIDVSNLKFLFLSLQVRHDNSSGKASFRVIDDDSNNISLWNITDYITYSKTLVLDGLVAYTLYHVYLNVNNLEGSHTFEIQAKVSSVIAGHALVKECAVYEQLVDL